MVSILDKAIVFATERHSGIFRKGTKTPFIVHPLETVSIAAGMTNDFDVLAATVLHDVVEDTPTTIDEIREVFGERVASLVAAESEDKMPDIPPSESWKMRKQATIDALQPATYEEKIIILSDKLSNIRAISRDYINVGDAIWERFNQKDKKMHEWYYRSIAENLMEFSNNVAYQEYCQLVNKVFD